MTNNELKARIDELITLGFCTDADYTLAMDIIKAVRDHIPDDDYEGKAPEHIYYCYDGMRFDRHDTLANAIKDKL